MNLTGLTTDIGTWKSLAGAVAVALGAIGLGNISGQVQDALIGAGTALIAVDHVILAYRHRTVVNAPAPAVVTPTKP